MSEVNFKFKVLQTMHESLLQKQQNISEENKQDFAREVRDYIERAKQAGSTIPSTLERDQVRANLRYWANYIYSIDKTFPDTELAPSAVEGKPFSIAIVSIVIIVAIAIVVVGIFQFGNFSRPRETETPLSAPTATIIIEATQTIEPIQVTETPTTESSGFNVTLSSPANGDFITPTTESGEQKITIEFKGTFDIDNLDPRWAIHVVFINGDKIFPIKENYPIPDQATSNEWTIQTELEENAEEMSKAQSYSVAVTLALDSLASELLSDSTETGIDINALPSTVFIVQDTSRVLFRKAYKVIQEPRIVYAFFDGISYDLYTSRLDGSDVIQIRSTQNESEMFPNLSPDGTKIVYVKRLQEANSDAHTYAISIMDSNGQNDHEITDRSNNVLESPQWSPDSSYISYTMGETRGASNRVYWSIHAYNLVTQENTSISGEPQIQVTRYSSWIPNTNTLVVDAAISDRTRFLQASMDSEEHSVYFDPNQYVSQPNISIFENGHLLTYTVIGPAPNYTHDVYGVIDPEGQDSFDGTPVLLIRSGGQVVDYPQPDPESNTLYYTRNGAILRVEYEVEGNQITLIRRANTSASGETVIAAGPTREAIYFDINFMNAFFPLN